jgi:acetyl-CoA synthetase
MSNPVPMWQPTAETIEAANVTHFGRAAGLPTYDALYAWSIEHPHAFWQAVVQRLGVVFRCEPETTLDLSTGVEQPTWLPGARLNIVESCFQAGDDALAIIASTDDGCHIKLSRPELLHRVQQVAASLRAAGFQPGDRLAIVMPMTIEAVVIYLGVVYAGCTAVSIADSFAAPEIAKRLEISQAKAVFCCDWFRRGDRQIELYSRVVEAGAQQAIVIPSGQPDLRVGDVNYADFLVELSDTADVPPDVHGPDHWINVLFSSGTTGDPKAIPWDQTVPIKCAADGFFHQDVHPGDVLCWPTNLGWMMGPWLIFAALINRATIALYHDLPTAAGFGQFVQDAQVTMLGVVPTLVRAWRASGEMEPFDWSAVRCFSSTGEASSADDMKYLSGLANTKPVIEYCGGTEIGGGYITSTVVQPNVAGAFSTPAVGSRFVLLEANGQPADEGQLFLVPPALGLSRTLLNRDHHETYYEGTPTGPSGEILRRHGDYFRRLPDGYYQAGGRVDDTMNLGGIKTSSAEIEQVLNRLPAVNETAAIALPMPESGPDRLVVFVVPATESGQPDESSLLREMNDTIKRTLNPLFKIAEVRVVPSLPRTASNKVMRRELRRACLGG